VLKVAKISVRGGLKITYLSWQVEVVSNLDKTGFGARLDKRENK
jgi:hypothetical protein